MVDRFMVSHPIFSVYMLSSLKGYEGVYSKPSEHQPPSPVVLIFQPHQLLHSDGLSAGQQLQPLTVSLTP